MLQIFHQQQKQHQICPRVETHTAEYAILEETYYPTLHM